MIYWMYVTHRYKILIDDFSTTGEVQEVTRPPIQF